MNLYAGAAKNALTMTFPDHTTGPRRSRKSRKTRAMPSPAALLPSRALLRKFGLHKVIDLDSPRAEPHRDTDERFIEHDDDAPGRIDPAVAALIDEIRAHNPSASLAFLATFTKRDLEVYLEHLANAKEPRGRSSRWLRPGDTPAMVLRQQHD